MHNKKSNGVKKILFFLTQSEFGGAQRYVFDLATNLKNDFEVAVSLPEQENTLKLAKILHKNNIKSFIIPNLKRNISPLNDALTLLKIIKLIKNFQPDIIHLNSSKISILGSIAAFIVKLRAAHREPRVIYTAHGWVFNEPLPGWQKSFYLWAEKFTAKFKNQIICVSEYDRQLALNYKIAPENKLTTIHNGLAPTEFYSKEEARQIFAKIQPVILERSDSRAIGSLWFNDKTQDSIAFGSRMTSSLIIGSIGNLYKTKGYEYFIRAADILINQDHLPASFIIIGDGQERKNLQNLIKKYNLENNFILTGRLDGAAKLLPAFDIYVCSSVKEGLPYSILEAMQAGLPIATTDVGGIPEIIVDKKTGLVSKPAEAASLAKNIKKLFSNKNLRIELGENAKLAERENFILKSMVEATKKIYFQ